MPPIPRTLPLRLYRALAPLLAMPALRRSDRKLESAGIAEARLGERRGHPSRPRPSGPLVWIHAASIGESLSALPLVTRLCTDATVLVTTGTGTSAQVMGARLPPGALHQFVPIDTPAAVQRFLDHWKPDLGVFVESEIWPTLIETAYGRGIPLALVNARLSQRTLAGWGRLPRTASALLSGFSLIRTQDSATRDGIAALSPSAPTPMVSGNLKAAVPPPGADPDTLETLARDFGSRAVWVASSTHPGEDAPVIAAHTAIRRVVPDALCILVPRHPERGEEIAALARAEGCATARRGAGDAPDEHTSVYVADSIGETGLWYRLAPLVFLAGSWGEVGGHNPWEPAALGAAVLHGPSVRNARADYAALRAAGAAREVADAAALAEAIAELLTDPDKAKAMQDAARSASGQAEDMADRLAMELTELMKTRSAP